MKNKSNKRIAAVLCVGILCTMGAVGYMARDSVSRVYSDVKNYFSDNSAQSIYYNEATRTKINYEVDESSTDSVADVTTEEFEKISDAYASAYFLQYLTEDEQNVYHQLYKGIYEFDTSIPIQNDVISQEDIGDFIVLFTSANPYVNYIGEDYTISVNSSGFVTSINVEYSKSKEQADEERARVDSKIEEILTGISDKMSDYQIVKYFHDSLVLNCKYDENSSQPYSAYGCLIEGKCVCEGYSKAMMALCDRAGINIVPVVGEAGESGSTQAHIWNKILIDDAWYGFDVTWDDPVSDIGDDYVRYDYFGITDTALDVNHFADANKYMNYPAAISDSADYFVVNNLLCKDVLQANEVMSNAVRLSVENGDRFARIKCINDNVYMDTSDMLFDNNGSGESGMFEILNNVLGEYDQMAVSKYSIIKNDEMRTITVKFLDK